MCDISKEIRGAALYWKRLWAYCTSGFQNNANKSMRKVTRALSKNNITQYSEGVFLCGFLGVLERKKFCAVMGW